VKASPRWRQEYGRALAELHAAGVLDACHGVYLEHVSLRDRSVRVLPFAQAARSGHIPLDELLQTGVENYNC
jgi:hypothetical protein